MPVSPRALVVMLGVVVAPGCTESDEPAEDTEETWSAGGTEGPESIDFSGVDQQLEAFVAEHPAFDGASLVLVRRGQGTLHQAAYGKFDPDELVMLASTSKMISVSTLMALAEDPAVDFDMTAPLETYADWDPAWPSMTTEQLVSNTSGLPGLQYLDNYGLHICQFTPTAQLQICGQAIFETHLDGVPGPAPGTSFDYGGSQWQLAGAVAEVVSGRRWSDLVDQYITGPCGLEGLTYGNMVANPDSWSGDPADYIGETNPSIEGGAIAHAQDYAKLLELHLNDGRCGDVQVLSPQALASMQRDRGTAAGSRDADFGFGPIGYGYGMGWWVVPRDESEPYLFVDPGAYGAISWIDVDRGYGGVVLVADYVNYADTAADAWTMVVEEVIPAAEAAIDGAEP